MIGLLAILTTAAALATGTGADGSAPPTPEQLQVAPHSNCWAVAGERYHLPPYLLYAMASQESSYNPQAVAFAKNGTHSVGLMMVNSSWFPQLEAAGISEAMLYEPCINLQVGSWILAGEVRRYGYSWEAIGAYFAGPHKGPLKGKQLQDYRTYAGQVLSRWRRAIDGDLLRRVGTGGKPTRPRRKPAPPAVYIGDIRTLSSLTPPPPAQPGTEAVAALQENP